MGTPHVHAAVIKSWADGAAIQTQTKCGWQDAVHPMWYNDIEYRVKPEPDSILLRRIELISEKGGNRIMTFGSSIPNVVLTFDGTTRQLKSVRVLKHE